MRLRLLFFLVLSCVPAFAPPAQAAAGNSHPPRTCLVVGITDGDTLTARCGRPGAYEQVKVRIAAIDAPEKAQPFGERSRQALARLCIREDAVIRDVAIDRYGRTVADVSCNAQDVGSTMVSQGWAWVYDYDRIATHRGGGLFSLQDDARAQHSGLWADEKPVPPWEWRKARRADPPRTRRDFSLF